MSVRASAPDLRHLLKLGVSAAALLAAAPTFAQATTQPAPDQAGQNNSGNPNDSPSQDEQQAGNAAVTGDGTAETGDIVVTGFRASIENAVAEKKSRDLIVEAISAEDIGRLPDPSIAEAIARLPGLTSQRLNGRSNNISIRGFAPDFSTTLLNGRQQTSTGDNRAVEYDQYPAEVVNQVVVYKTADASLVGQGLSGTVDLRTIRPLDYGKSVVALNARGAYSDLGKLNAESREFGYRLNATYVDQFLDDTIGVALSAAYLDEPFQIQEFNAWGYAGAGTAADPAIIGGSKSYVTSTVLKRLGLQGTLQWRPSPNLTATFDGFFSDFTDEQIKRGIELPLGFQAFGTQIDRGSLTVQDGFATAGTFRNVQGVVRNDAFDRKAKLYSFGYNVAYEGEDGWNAQLDISFSRTDRNEIVLESYSGTGYGADAGATDTINFQSGRSGTVFRPTLNYSDPALIRLTDPLGWGGSTIQAGYLNDRDVQDSIRQYRTEVEKEFESFPVSALRFGLNYTRQRKSLSPNEAFLVLAGGVRERTLPEEFRLETTNLDYLGLGPILSYDPRALLAGGIYTRPTNTSFDVVAKAFVVREDIMTAYLQSDISAELGRATLTGNAGVQAVLTEQKSSGLVNAGNTLRQTTAGDDYIDILPSLNLSLRFPSDFVVRFGAARQMQRPRIDDMRVALGYGFNTAEGIITGGGGNPFLRPIRSNSFDLTFEKYFGTRGYLALQGFYKDLKSFVYNLEVPFNYAGFPLPTGAPANVPLLGRANVPINGEGGKIYGAELAGTLPFGQITSALDGFGITGGASYTKTEILPAPGGEAEDIPGYSRWVANGTAFFEKYGLNVRGSVRYRSTFVGELSGFGANRVRRRAIDEIIVDGQIGYDFQQGSALQGLSVFVQGQNLTDEPFVTINGDERIQVIDYQTFGRRFLVGATYRF